MSGAEPYRRGDIVTVAGGSSEFGGKPRPAIVLHGQIFGADVPIPICPVTSTAIEAVPLLRVPLPVAATTGLQVPSWAMIDLVQTARRRRIGRRIGRLDDATMLTIGRALVVFLGLA